MKCTSANRICSVSSFFALSTCVEAFQQNASNCSVCRDDKAQLADIFLKKGPYLKMYSTYIREFDKNVALLEEQSKRNSAFGAVVREFEVMQLA